MIHKEEKGIGKANEIYLSETLRNRAARGLTLLQGGQGGAGNQYQLSISSTHVAQTS